jgi:hypothetical protein
VRGEMDGDAQMRKAGLWLPHTNNEFSAVGQSPSTEFVCVVCFISLSTVLVRHIYNSDKYGQSGFLAVGGRQTEWSPLTLGKPRPKWVTACARNRTGAGHSRCTGRNGRAVAAAA